MKGRLILSDYAEEHGGKLYIMGAGWSRIQAGIPTAMGLGIIIMIDWDEIHTALKIRARLLTSSGEPVLDSSSQPLAIEGTIEAGPKPGTEKGAPLNASVAVRIVTMPLSPGRYMWELSGEPGVLDQVEFEAIEGVP